MLTCATRIAAVQIVLRTLSLCIFAAIVLLSPSRGLAANVEMLSPRAGSTVTARNAETHLLLRKSLNGEVVKVRVDESGNIIESIVAEQDENYEYLHFRLPLSPDRNSFTLLPGEQSFELYYRPIRANLNANELGKEVYLFHKNDQLPDSCSDCHDLIETRTSELTGIESQVSCVTCHQNVIDKAEWQHSPAVNRQCLSCHQQFIKPFRIGFPVAKEELCFACHTGKQAWLSKPFVHGPLKVGGCNLCHNPHGDDYRYQLWADGSLDLCLACHSDMEALFDLRKPLPFVHGIIKGQGCVACHDPHATDNQFLLRKPINELCVGCHTKLAGIKRGHPVGGHPLEGPTERRRKDRKLTCTSCHDPHGSKFRKLLVGDTRGGNVCTICHR